MHSDAASTVEVPEKTWHWTDLQGQATAVRDAVALIKSGHRVFVHGASATPTPLLQALAGREDLQDVTLYHLHTSGPAAFAEPRCTGHLRSVSLFAGASLRRPIEEGLADFMPVFLSDIPALFESGRIPLDVAILQLSPPDAHGYCSLGTSVDAAKAAAETARIIIAEINEQMPRTIGNNLVPLSRIAA